MKRCYRGGRYRRRHRTKKWRRWHTVMRLRWAMARMAEGMMAGATSPARPWFAITSERWSEEHVTT